MHIMNRRDSTYTGYNSGGCRLLIDKVNDKSTMQESNSTGMKGESFNNCESPQNYGFSSAVFDADKGQDGQIEGSAEGYMSFMGGNRSFPVCGLMDDRRHRVKGLDAGDSCQYRGREDAAQMHMAKDGNYFSRRDDQVQRHALVPAPKEDQQQQQAKTGGQGGAGQQQQKKKPKGQELVTKGNQDSDKFFELSGKNKNFHAGYGDGHSITDGNQTIGYVKEPKRSYRATSDHVHESFDGSTIWVDAAGCWSSSPILIKEDACSPSAGGPGAPAGAAHPIA